MTDPRHPRRSLWLVVQDFIHVLFGLFATPEIIAARGAYLRKDWALLARWLRAGEALMRVFNDPAPYAARLARRLHARPDCARAMLWHAPDLPPLVGAAGFAKAHDAALAAVAAFNTG